MAYETLLYKTEGEVGILTYNRPKVVNALNLRMIEELYDFWQARQRDFDTRVVIVTGGGEKGFCSGLDMKAVATEFVPADGRATAESTFNGQIHFSVLMRLMRSCPQPIIAAVHGPAMGAGLSFALAADVRLASEDAFFCAQYINIGTGGADLSSSFFLPKIVGWGKAAEMCLTGERVPAPEAWRIGLVNHLHTREELLPAAKAMAAVMCSKNKFGLRMTKDAFNAALNGSSLEDTNRMEDR
ncbi:MAG: enoyl-CoA hydratase/isomerase family protein, partial [Actinobacteria bacterium]|nr:enoyl-CoA hydratase/isomerase family protein [Actinomycetota bacterium]MBU1944350.1 enoyl-CoA hydratase/isomerase family protein [Actinomycetota bacterium]MBU2688335.1 enoyl-CoA hydratase/isomerase family protein [Actinomycetota bacterium]